jgi:hypothetical protein
VQPIPQAVEARDDPERQEDRAEDEVREDPAQVRRRAAGVSDQQEEEREQAEDHPDEAQCTEE